MMKRPSKINLRNSALFLVLAIVLQASGPAGAVMLDRVVAVVNDDVITYSEMEKEGKEFLDKVREKAPVNSQEEALLEAQNRVLDSMISQRLISQKAQDAKIQISDAEFEEAYRKNRQSLKLSDEEFSASLKQSGLTEENYKNNLRNQLLRDKLVLYEVRSKIIITEEMIQQYYVTEYTREVREGGYYLQQMGFTWGRSEAAQQSDEVFEADKIRALKRAEAARQLVLDGEDFGNVAREKSELPSAAEGGDIGVLQEEDMAASMKDAIVPLNVGEISSIMETSSGYQFFKLLSRQEGGTVNQVPYETVKEEIRNKLFDKKFKDEFQKWVDDIKKQAYVKKMLL